MKTETKVIRILTADDHALLRGGIESLVEIEPDMELEAQASTGREAIEQFRRHQPEITLMDLQMPDISGIEAIIAIRSEFPNARGFRNFENYRLRVRCYVLLSRFRIGRWPPFLAYSRIWLSQLAPLFQLA